METATREKIIGPHREITQKRSTIAPEDRKWENKNMAGRGVSFSLSEVVRIQASSKKPLKCHCFQLPASVLQRKLRAT